MTTMDPSRRDGVRSAASDRTTKRASHPGRHRRTTGINVETYRNDPLFPRMARAVDAILRSGKVVAPVDVLVGMGLLTPEHLEDWRRGRVPYLERVINCNLARLSRVLRILPFYAHDLNLVPSITVYMRWGKGPKHRLRFSKTGEPKIEEAYSRHFVWPGKGPFHMPGERGGDDDAVP
jgi:hypothetical protein